MPKVLVPLSGTYVAPRFDQATEVWIGHVSSRAPAHGKTFVLTQPSAEELSQLIITEHVQTLICGAIENEIYEYLIWKKIKVIDYIIGPYERALEKLGKDNLHSGDILFTKEERSLD